MLSSIRIISHDIHLEYHQYLLTVKLKTIIPDQIENYLVQKGNESRSSDEPIWATIYNKQETENDINLKLQVGKDRYQKVRNLISEHFKVPIEYPSDPPVMTEDFFEWGIFQIGNDEVNLRNLISVAGYYPTLKMLIRYRAKDESIYNSAIKRKFAVKLYDIYNVRVEGFSSPLNSRFMGMKDMKIYSLFLDTDQPFGSLGSFFENDPPPNVNILVNPPYIDELLTRVAARIVSIVENGNNNDIIFIGPYDHYQYHRLFDRYLIYRKVIPEGFKYEDNVGNFKRIDQRLLFCYFSENKEHRDVAFRCYSDFVFE